MGGTEREGGRERVQWGRMNGGGVGRWGRELSKSARCHGAVPSLRLVQFVLRGRGTVCKSSSFRWFLFFLT